MDARSFAKKTQKLTKRQKNDIIGKKCCNVASYKPPAERGDRNLQPSGTNQILLPLVANQNSPHLDNTENTCV